MEPVYVVADNMLTSLGLTTEENIAMMKQGKTGVREIADPAISEQAFFGSVIDNQAVDKAFTALGNKEDWTKLERFFLFSINDALQQSKISLNDERSLLIISTTKGNIDLLSPEKGANFPKKRLQLGGMAEAIGRYFACKTTPLVLSNACISGVLALTVGARLIRAGQYDHVVVAGGDLCSKFTVSGFQSLKAISKGPCKPYDKNRSGINLGEAVGTILLSKDKNAGHKPAVAKILGGASSNDANHISGPSRTGEGLYIAIEKTLQTSGIQAKQVDFISAHGTATLYNDEMESKAFAHTKLLDVPVNSLKGYFGHSLGAAGTIESIVTLASMRENYLFKTLGFEEMGVSNPMNVVQENQAKELKVCLKSASGFGGCNAAIIFEKL